MYDKNFRDEDCFMVSRCSCRNFPPQLKFDDESERYYEGNWEEDDRQNYGRGKQERGWKNDGCNEKNWNNHSNYGNNWNCRPNHNNCGCHDCDDHKDDCRCRDDHKDNCHKCNNRRKCCFGFFRCF